jgi:hypothetical protein
MDKEKKVILPGMENFHGSMGKKALMQKITGKQERDLEIKAPLLYACMLFEYFCQPSNFFTNQK